MTPSNTQIKKLGERLARVEFPSDDDLDLLTAYERSFQPALDFVVFQLDDRFHVRATPRSKTVGSIVQKVRRERTRLTTMQDIVGCRVVVSTITEQERLVREIERHGWAVRTDDRRQRPSHGYRAVHLIVTVESKWVEVQVRTELQDGWAQLSEKLADRFGLSIKYGGGPDEIREFLDSQSAEIAEIESLEGEIEALAAGPGELEDLRAEAARLRQHPDADLTQVESFERKMEAFDAAIEDMKGRVVRLRENRKELLDRTLGIFST